VAVRVISEVNSVPDEESCVIVIVPVREAREQSELEARVKHSTGCRPKCDLK
jgi:hypothetical protein